MVKVYHVPQGSYDWLQLRLGLPTASEFHRIITPGGKFSAQSRAYAIRLVAEKLLNRSLMSLENLEWVDRGKELEPQAIKSYEFQNDVTTAPIGFLTTDDGRIGASPDRLVGSEGLLEIKCPAPQTHLAYLLDGFDKDYLPQVQGQLFVSELDWADWMSYSDEMPPVVVRAYRDEPYLAKLRAALDQFCDAKEELMEQARGRGLFAERRRMATVVDTMAEEETRRAAAALYAPSQDRDFYPPPLEPLGRAENDLLSSDGTAITSSPNAHPAQRSSADTAGEAPRFPNDDASPAARIQAIEVVKPQGGRPSWSATRKRLAAAFLALPTVADCDAFRARNSGTIGLLRSSDAEQFEIFNMLAAAHERGLRGGAP